MNISICNINSLKWNFVKEKIKKYNSDIMVFIIDFSQNKEQINNLLFFDKLAKNIKQFFIIFDVDFSKCKLKYSFARSGFELWKI